jgi:hypothetical protein
MNRGYVSAPVRQPWRLHPFSQPLSRYLPVLAVTLLRERDFAWEILAGVRTEVANKTHPDVVSVPTLRISSAVAREWTDGLSGPDGDAFRSGGAALREVANLLARKLGAADVLELGQIRLEPLDLDVWQGTSVIGEDENGPITEDLTMFNACVEVSAGADLCPGETASYKPLLWARLDDFLQMVRTRDVGQLNAGLNPLQFCAYGLCLTSTERIVSNWLENARAS